MRKCFIISPIGKEDSEEREHANQVFDYIIKPALEECNIEPIRADQMYQAGKITDQIYEAILTYDMSIVVLAFNNPNVYYELAVAQCAVRPVIILVEKGKTLPFDLKDERSVFYDLTIPSYTERTFINQIVKIIQNLEKADWKVSSSIPGFSPLTSKKDSEYQFFREVFDFGGKMEWQNIVNDSKEKLYLMGTALRTWRHLEEFGEQLIEKAKNGCEIKLMIMDPENEFLSQIHNERSPQLPRYETVHDTVLECSKFYSHCAAQSENIEFRQIHHGRLTQNQAINENYCVYMPHFYSTLITYSPCWKFKKESQVYQNLLREFNELWDINAPIKKVVLKEKVEEKEEILQDLKTRLSSVEELIDKKEYSDAKEQLNYILESAEIFNLEEIKSIALEKLKNLRDPDKERRDIKKILEFEYENQKEISKTEMVTHLNIEISDTDYYLKLLMNPVDYASSEIENLEQISSKILKEISESTKYDLVVTLNYELETAQKIGKFLLDQGFISHFRDYPLRERKAEPGMKAEDLVIYLCYAEKDTELFNISEVSKKLQSYNDIKEVFYWQKHWETNIIKSKLERCNVFLLFCSENALESKAVNNEWTTADMMSMLIIPIFLDSNHVPTLLKSRLGMKFDLTDFDKNIERLHKLILRKTDPWSLMYT
ncbi:MAG: toll/interleukin-1 receptor domain-containing protein [Promethearchaeota archaeon]|jgi:ribosomal protein S8